MQDKEAFANSNLKRISVYIHTNKLLKNILSFIILPYQARLMNHGKNLKTVGVRIVLQQG
jgi:hypothetical protein